MSQQRTRAVLAGQTELQGLLARGKCRLLPLSFLGLGPEGCKLLDDFRERPLSRLEILVKT